MFQNQRENLNTWNYRKSDLRSELYRFKRPVLDMSLELYGYNAAQLRSFLPKSGSGPSTAPFVHDALRNGIEDVNLINAALYYLEWQWVCKQPSATCFDKVQMQAAKMSWCNLVDRNAKLLRLYLEFPFKTSFDLAKGHSPVVVYNKDKFGRRRPIKPVGYDHINEHGQCSHVYGRVSDGTSITFLPYLDANWDLICFDWGSMRWENTKVRFGPAAWDVNPDGTFIHVASRSATLAQSAARPPSSISKSEKLAADPEQSTLVRTLGVDLYYSTIDVTRRRPGLSCLSKASVC